VMLAAMITTGLQASTPESLLSPSGRFLISYHLTGDNAVYPEDSNGSGVPDFVEYAAIWADSAWNHLVGRLGFADPVGNGTPYEFILERRGSSVFGETVINPGGGTNGGSNSGNATITYIHPTFEGFPSNLDPDGSRWGSLKVTIAHELRHASQYTETAWQGDAGNIHWMELDAILAENLVFPDVKDYYRHLGSVNSIFRDPKIPVPVYPWQVTWLMYWQERHGPGFMPEVWHELASGNTMTEAIGNVLLNSGLDWREELARNYLWHLASGANSGGDEGFADRLDYPTPDPPVINNLPGLPLGVSFTYRPVSAGFHRVVPAASDTGDVILFVMAPDSLAGFGVADFADGHNGDVSMLAYAPDRFGRLLVNTGLRWEETGTLGLVPVNASVDRDRTLHIMAGRGQGIERLRYGDATQNGDVGPGDVSAILGSLTGERTPLQGFARFASDVTGNGTVTVFDAALILERLQGGETPYPADANGNGFGPEYNLLATGTGSPFAGIRGGSGEHLSPLTVRLLADETSEALESGLFIVVENNGFDPIRSMLLEMIIPREHLEVLDPSGSWIMIPGAAGSVHTSGDTVRVAIALPELFGGGTLAEIPLYALKEGTIELSLLSVLTDESVLRHIWTEGTSLLINPRPAVSNGNDPELPQTLTLHQNYPNPFNPGTMIRFDLPAGTEYSLRLFDLTGRLIGVVSEGYREAGSYEMYMDAGLMGLGSGVYLMVLRTGDESRLIKLNLIR
jgi:hypothetical protein